MKHPRRDYTTEQAQNLARSLKYGPLPNPDAPTPGIKESIGIVRSNLKTCGFNWITAQVALEVLLLSDGQKVEAYT